MSTLSKVFLVFVFLAALGLLWASARMLKTWTAWRTRYTEHVVKIAEVDEVIRQMEEGDDQHTSNLVLSQQLQELITNRGRVWFDCNPKRIDPNGTLAVRTSLPNPPGIAVGDVLYVFQTVDENAVGQGIGNRRYLGEFKVAAAGPAALDNLDAPNLSLVPTRPLSAEEVDFLSKQGGGPWALYEAMPADSYEVLGQLDEAQVRALIPTPQDPELAAYVEALVQEHLRHGKAAADGDAPERVMVQLKFVKDFVDLDAAGVQTIEQHKIPNNLVTKDVTVAFTADVADDLIAAEIAEEAPGTPDEPSRAYYRRLRDYRTEFEEYARLIPKLQNAIAAASTDRDNTNDAAMRAEKYLAEREQLRMALEAEQARLAEENAAVASYRAQMEAELTAYQEGVAALEQRNRELAAEWKRLQTEAAQRIEERATAQASE